MRSLLILLLALTVARAAAPPFEILPGDRVLLLGDTLLEREGTYGYLETRMCEQFADRPFTVRNLSFAGDTPLGLSRAAFDPPAKGWERLLEQIALVRPTVVFLGYGMAASLQEMTDRSQDPTLNRDTARYGEEPMSAARFKKELGTLMDAIEKAAAGYLTAEAQRTQRGAEGEKKGTDTAAPAVPNPSADLSKTSAPLRLEKDAAPGGHVRFVLLSPIRHEDLRATRPGLPDPAEHNKLLAAYAQAIEELVKERGARFVDLQEDFKVFQESTRIYFTDNGIHLRAHGYDSYANGLISSALNWRNFPFHSEHPEKLGMEVADRMLAASAALRAAIIAKNELFFHRWRPANSTYLTGFRKHEQGQNAKEMAMFDPLIEKAEAEIERLKKEGAAASPGSTPVPGVGSGVPPERTSSDVPTGSRALTSKDTAEVREGGTPSPARETRALPGTPPPPPQFTVADGYQIELWAENPLLEKPTQMNWDALGRLWVCSSSLYPMIEPGQMADDKILILSDPAGTGKATKSEVFVRGLLIPTGVVPDLAFNNEHLAVPASAPQASDAASGTNAKSSMLNAKYGAYVGQSTELLHFAPDGTKRIVLSGFGTEDTHHILHTLRWGPDGRLYFNQSIYIHSHLETPWGMVRLNSGGCLAYDPRTERTEVFAKGWVNSWGHAWDRWGQSFFTDGAGGGGINWAFPGAMFVTYEGARQTVPSVSPGSYPKFAGLELIYSPHFPADWQGNAITCDFRAHRIVRFSITDLSMSDEVRGMSDEEKKAAAASPPTHTSSFIPHTSSPSSGYVTKEQPDLVRTSDLSFRPIDIKLGPDGALYVADWSNPVINHGEVDFRDPRRDHHMGRIWRISKKGEPVVKWEPLIARDSAGRDGSPSRPPGVPSGKGIANPPVNATDGSESRPYHAFTTAELLDKLLSGSLWEKEQARRVLQVRGGEKDKQNPADPLANEVGFGAVGVGSRAWADAKKSEQAEIEAMWVGAGFGYSPSEILATTAKDARVRSATVRIISSSIVKTSAMIATIPTKTDSFDPANGREWIGTLHKALDQLIADPNPRVRLEAMRALARIPTARSAELVLDAAVGDFSAEAQRTQRGAEDGKKDAGATSPSSQNPSANLSKTSAPLRSNEPDVFYQHAAWLSINDLAQPWLDALASGAWKAEGRERQLEFALNALPPAAARGALAQVLGTEPRDFAKGPWAELIGRAGDPAALRQLFDALLVSFGMDCCPGDELKNIRALPIDDATALRCVGALLEAARVRNQRPTGDLLPLERLVFHTNAAVRAGILRLVGYWKPAPGLDWLRGVFSENALDPACAASAIESAREIGGASAVELLKKLTGSATPAPTRQQASVAVAALRLNGSDITVVNGVRTETYPSDPSDRNYSLGRVFAAISAAPNEDAALASWRDLFKIKGAVEAVEKAVVDESKSLSPGTYVPAPGDDFTVTRYRLTISKIAVSSLVRAAREAGKRGEPLLAALTPLAGDMPKPVLGAADFKAIAARMWTQGGDAAQGELIYRRATSGCVTCHAIGGAGGVVGPSLTSLGASAPLDYIIESLLVPNAKVKEGYNGVTLKLKDGSEITGIQARETAQEVILRNVAGQETAVVKANIAGKTDIGSIMPAGLLDALNDNQRMNLYAFLAELGKPGPFDASKANTARVWKLYPGTATDLALKGAPSDAAANALTLVDGRLLKDTVKEALQLVTNPGAVIYAVTQFQSTGKTHLDLTGIAKAFLDGQPLTITGDLAPELPAGIHTLAVKLDVPTLPEVLRASSPDASFVTN